MGVDVIGACLFDDEIGCAGIRISAMCIRSISCRGKMRSVMSAVLLALVLITNPAISISAIPTSADSVSPKANAQQQIGAAQSRHNWTFGAYVIILALTVIGTYLVWSTGNKVQEEIQADADARILDARNKATILENDLNAEKGNVLSLQRDASDAKAAQQRVEIELEQQKARTALAERKLIELQPRIINNEQRKLLVELLSPSKIVKGRVLINSAMDGEAWQFGDAISTVLKEAGFPVTEIPFGNRAIAFNKPGAFLWIKDGKNQPKHGGPIAVAFSRVGINFTGEVHPSDADVPDLDTVVIAISSHP